MASLQKQREWPMAREQLNAVGDAIVRATGLRIDWALLTEAERKRLAALTDAISADNGWNLKLLKPRALKRWEKLVGKGLGQPDYFEQNRVLAKISAKAAEAGRDASKPPRRVRYEQEGSITLPAEWLGGRLAWDYLAVVAYLAAVFEGSAKLAPGAWLEPGPILCLDITRGLMGTEVDPDSTFAAFPRYLEYCQMAEFIEVEKTGKNWRISPGRLMKEARERRDRQ